MSFQKGELRVVSISSVENYKLTFFFLNSKEIEVRNKKKSGKTELIKVLCFLKTGYKINE